MPNGKTIRQIADEIGVTRQAIYKKFKINSAVSDSLKAHSFTVEKVKYYTAEGEKIIKSMFADNSDTFKGTVNLSTEQLTDKLTHDNLTTNQVDRLTDLFSTQLKAKDQQKDRQLAEKDKQIAMLMEQSNNLTQALQAAQALAAADKKQLLLQSGQKNEQLENPDSSENVKKGFFRKIFGK